MMRASMLEQTGMDYVTTARAKGLTERRITLVHVLRNALLPVVTIAGLQAANMLGGSVIIESIFDNLDQEYLKKVSTFCSTTPT